MVEIEIKNKMVEIAATMSIMFLINIRLKKCLSISFRNTISF